MIAAAAWAVALPAVPGSRAHLPDATLPSGVASYRDGDLSGARMALDGWLASDAGPWGRERAAGRFLLGWIHLTEGRDNLASEQFTKVRVGGGPLQERATYYEALADHRRGRHAVAARECEAYRNQYPQGLHAEDCLLLIGDAWVAHGARQPALDAYEAWLRQNPRSEDEESVRVMMAMADANANARRGGTALRHLAGTHSYHCNGAAAQQALDGLEAEGLELAPLTPVGEEMARAVELRTCGALEDAWSLYLHLGTAHVDEPGVKTWFASESDRMAWRTRQYATIAKNLTARYDEEPDAEVAWKSFRASFRGGDFQTAGTFGARAMKAHPSHYRWRRATDQVAHAWNLAGDYQAARELWDRLAASNGRAAEAARWFGAWTSVMAEDWDEAITRLDALVAAGGEHGLAARYYRGKARAALDQSEAAAADWNHIRKHEPESWYALLLESRWRQAGDDPSYRRAGSWPLPRAEPAPEPAASETRPPRFRLVPATGERRRDPTDLSRLTWRVTPPPEPLATAAEIADPPRLVPPRGDVASTWYDPEAAQQQLASFARAHAELWADLPAIADLAGVGLHDLSGPAMELLYEEWHAARRRRTPREATLRAQVAPSFAEWRALFVAAGDHHHASRFSYGLQKGALTTEDRAAAQRLAFPLAYRTDMLENAERHDVDPLLMWGVMRQESLFQATAVSSAGARGLLQVMPKTGARVAAGLGEVGYRPSSLEDPRTNVRYGTWYLGRLLDRFDGGWPLAVAAYNAGPVNVSSWYRPNRGHIDMDDFVEQIPLAETRDYVKKVSGWYATYVALYGPDGAVVDVPRRPGEDDPTIVDY